MANIKSAIKRAKTNEKSRLRNKTVKTNLKSSEKHFEDVVASGDKDKSAEEYKVISKKYDMAASKGIIHKNVADRKKSSFAKKVNAIG